MQHLNAALCSSATEFGGYIVADELWTATIHGSWTLGAHACKMPYNNISASCVTSGQIVCAGTRRTCNATASSRSTLFHEHRRECVTPTRHRGSWCNTSCTHFRESACVWRNSPWGLLPQRLPSVRMKHSECMRHLNAALCSSATEFGGYIMADELWTATIHGSWTLGAHACHMP